ncbi:MULTISPECIES: hypothetical protein [unclassified Ensifer]|uniref:hypothetical protein n=1 Tax=unclassified Ensifer TaxID=2633371 RepID=UPI00070A8386|nr:MULTISPECIES: hypothetical protein [unclassified Ensifer]KQW47201.1 hypothetical protein ASD02_34415 [Ensifer sp. Root1252]KRC68753.1 hypothetical protein ASE32_35245 [Ensifer sp. Root231]KRC93919.1 hypothetical protein ASE47_34910 [Ensifer sp. Root258]
MYTRQWAVDRRQKVFQEAISDRNFYALRKAWTTETGDTSLTSRVSQYITEEIDHFKYRMVEMRVAVREQTVAFALFHEWSLVDGCFPGHEHFIDTADSVSQQDYEMAEFLSSCWDEDDHPLEYGNIVLFDRLSIVVPNPVVWPCLLRGIDRQFARNASLLVLKAFPLEFEAHREDRLGTDTGDLPEFARRQAAMRRLYRRQLGVTDGTGDFGKRDWMWRVIRGPVADFG